MLDAELDKVETFYAEREKEMSERTKRIREQLNELGVHRQMFHVGGLFFRSRHPPTQRDPLAIRCARKDRVWGQESAVFSPIGDGVVSTVVVGWQCENPGAGANEWGWYISL